MIYVRLLDTSPCLTCLKLILPKCSGSPTCVASSANRDDVSIKKLAVNFAAFDISGVCKRAWPWFRSTFFNRRRWDIKHGNWASPKWTSNYCYIKANNLNMKGMRKIVYIQSNDARKMQVWWKEDRKRASREKWTRRIFKSFILRLSWDELRHHVHFIKHLSLHSVPHHRFGGEKETYAVQNEENAWEHLPALMEQRWCTQCG